MAHVRTVEELRERLRSPRPQFLELWAAAPPDQSVAMSVG
jgi:hypothetical protein